ncbi:MAG: hypothetical protein K9M94_12705 [Spirochaetia bacterium]|nr:hypothetical protein [Spirochaetia bacterium]
MELEDSNGKIVVPQSPAEVDQMIDRLGRDLDHCILSEGELFIQAAGSAPGMIVQYGDPSGHYEAAQMLPPETVKELFAAFFQNDDSWRTRVGYTRIGGGSTSSGAPGSGADRGRVAGQQEKSLKDSLLDSVKREIGHNVSGMVRRGIRGAFRKFK